MSCGMKTPLANCLHQTSSILKQSLCFAPPLLRLLSFIFYASLNFSCYLTFSIPLSFSLGGSGPVTKFTSNAIISLNCIFVSAFGSRFETVFFFSILFLFFDGCGGLGTLGISPRGALTAASQTFSSRSTQCAAVWRTVRLYNFNNFVMSLSIKVSLVFCG